MKKVLSYLMAIALIVTSISFVGTDKVSAHQKYTTKGLVIDTSLVPQDSNISVKNKDGNEDFVNVSSDLNTLTVTGKISKLGLYEEVEPSYILDKKVTYSVDNSKVATVGESGKKFNNSFSRVDLDFTSYDEENKDFSVH